MITAVDYPFAARTWVVSSRLTMCKRQVGLNEGCDVDRTCERLAFGRSSGGASRQACVISADHCVCIYPIPLHQGFQSLIWYKRRAMFVLRFLPIATSNHGPTELMFWLGMGTFFWCLTFPRCF